MANWAKLQEDLTGLKVVKRAKYGIHFDKGGGQILANFSGKPCHFLDGKIWKPIDTKLLVAGDGYYGCPHSPVKVSKDGRVKVDKSDYSQFTELPSAKTGVLDGDRIVREFPGGKQYLYVTENGFREEIVVDKPTFPLEKFIAKTSGALPSKYKRSDITAVDADGAVHEFVNLGQFKKWLDAAVYPVTIDPDFSTTSTAGDTYLNSYYTLRNWGAAKAIAISGTNRTLYKFDCSSIAAGSTATAANIKITKSDFLDNSRVVTISWRSVSQANGDWIEGTGNGGGNAASGEPCFAAKVADGAGGVTTAWAGSAGLNTSGTDFEATVLASGTANRQDPANTQYTYNLNADGLTRIAGWFGSPNTNYGLRVTSSDDHGSYHTSEATTESYRPVLSVTYTAAGGALLRVNMNAQMQSLSGGFYG